MRLCLILLLLPFYVSSQVYYEGFSPYILGHKKDTTNAILVDNTEDGYVGFYIVRGDTVKLHLTPTGILVLHTDTSLRMEMDSLYLDSLATSTPAFFLGWDKTTKQVFAVDTTGWGGGGMGTNYWEITAGDTIDTKDYNIKLDSSFLMDYGNWLFGYVQNGGVPSELMGYYNDTAFSLIAVTDEIFDGTPSVNLSAGKLGGTNNAELNLWYDLSINESFTQLLSDAISIVATNELLLSSTIVLIDTLPKSAERFLMMYDSTSGQVSIMDTTGWGGGGMGTNYWTWVDAATDTLYNNQPPEGTGVIFLKSDVLTDRWLKNSTNTVFGIGAASTGFDHTSGVQGYYNTAIGNLTLANITNGYFNTTVGVGGLYSNTTGHSNTAIGASALYSNTTGSENTAIGFGSLSANTNSGSTAVGYMSLSSNTSGLSNTAIGASALYSNTTGYYNTAVGVSSLYNDTTGNENTALGWCSLFHNTNGSYNTAVGTSSLVDNTTGSENTAIGFRTLWKNTTGTQNVALGNLAGNNNLIGSYNVFLGYSAGSNETGSNKLYIANTSDATPLIFGDFAADSIRINGSCDITDFLKLVPQANPPSPATAGMIYSDTDGHLYHYDGSNWDQLDN